MTESMTEAIPEVSPTQANLWDSTDTTADLLRTVQDFGHGVTHVGLGESTTTIHEVVVDAEDGAFNGVLVGVIVAVIVALFCLVAVLLRYIHRRKGTYHTNEAKGTEFAEDADAAVKRDPLLQESVDEGNKEYFI